jgi:hypothetical protein
MSIGVIGLFSKEFVSIRAERADSDRIRGQPTSHTLDFDSPY